MAFEIYYTSAPEGLRPGDRGFCTVAATPGIPRNLWDRLEAMSGYRHLADNSSRTSPVSLAHTLIHLDGRELHVLSRVADAGLDYSHRTNSLAHHLVLQPAELAAGGPAWMLGQFGVMLERWDGHVGAIERAARLPMGDQSPQPCRMWQQIAGDAGWAGVVAETIAKSAWKPICLVFNPDQSLLPLVSEVLALLPARQRWQATFNTYFTSLPGGVTCQWRCCLANTPAAAAATRVSANGLVIDLSNPSGLGSPPAGPWVDAARSGQMMSAARRPSAGVKPAPAPAKGKPSPPPTNDRVPVEQIPLKSEPAIPVSQPVVIHRRSTASQPTWNLDGPAPQPEASWLSEQRRVRHRRLLMIYGLAIAAIGVGLWLEISAYRASSERPLPPPQTQQAIVVPKPPSPPPIIPIPLPPTQPVVSPPPTSLPSVVVVPPAPPVVVAMRPPPLAIVLNEYFPAPGIGTGIRDVQHIVDIPQDKLDDRDAITSLAISFPGNGGEKPWAYKQDDLDGEFTVKAHGNKLRPGITLFWHDEPKMRDMDKVASISLDRTHWQLEISFSTSLLLRRPHVANLGYWVLQNSTLVIGDRAGLRPQSVNFAGFATKPLHLLDPKVDVNFPTDLPASAKISLGKTVPEGWRQDKDATVATELHLEKPPGHNGVMPGFAVRFDAAGLQLKNDLSSKITAARADLQTSEADLKQADDDIQQLRDSFQSGTNAIEDSIKEWTARQKQHAENPQLSDLTTEQIQAALDNQKKRLAEHTAELEKELSPKNATRAACLEQVAVKRETLGAYTELKEVDLTVELPQNLPAGTVRLVRDGE